MKQNNKLLGFLCTTFSHHYIEEQKVTNHFKTYKCARCGKEVATNAKGKLEAITKKNKEAYSVLSSFVRKKRLSKNNKQLETNCN